MVEDKNCRSLRMEDIADLIRRQIMVACALSLEAGLPEPVEDGKDSCARADRSL
jgi:hypothetical protein